MPLRTWPTYDPTAKFSISSFDLVRSVTNRSRERDVELSYVTLSPDSSN